MNASEQMITEPITLAQTLKSETKNSHQRVEKYLSAILFDNALDKVTYQQILIAMHQAYSVMEHSVIKFDFARRLLSTRSKLAWIKDDLRYISGGTQCLVLSENLHNDLSAEEAIGMMYVMEGATLGGSVIYNRMKKHTWLSDGQGIAFFYNYGTDRAAMWREFQLELKQLEANRPFGRGAVIKGANAAFDMIYSLIKGHVNNNK